MMTPKDIDELAATLNAEGYQGYAIALEQHDQAQRAVIDGLSKKVKQLTAWSDKMFGTPCEEIRHQQKVEELEEKIKQQAKEITELNTQIYYLMPDHDGWVSWKEHAENLQEENKTLREALQACQSRLGCGCGDILCSTCNAAYDVAEQALKEVL